MRRPGRYPIGMLVMAPVLGGLAAYTLASGQPLFAHEPTATDDSGGLVRRRVGRMDREDLRVWLALDAGALGPGGEALLDETAEVLGGLPEVCDMKRTIPEGRDMEECAFRPVAFPVTSLRTASYCSGVTPGHFMMIITAMGCFLSCD